MANSITSPLRRLQRSTEQLAVGDFAQRAATNEGAPEIRSLARSYNSMTEQISGLLEQQREFAGDASPAHHIGAVADADDLRLLGRDHRDSGAVARQLVEHRDPDAALGRIEAASEETERLQRLVEGLLMIARSEGSTPATQRIDVSTLVRERAEMWAPFAAERGVRLLTSTPDGLAVMAVPNALEQIVDNYVDNALGAATEGDTVTITATRQHDKVGVHVIDEGPGMQPDHLARAFDRFWRAPDAPHGGSGIGLAVVQQLATLSGGHAQLSNRPDRSGLDASVVLPSVD